MSHAFPASNFSNSCHSSRVQADQAPRTASGASFRVRPPRRGTHPLAAPYSADGSTPLFHHLSHPTSRLRDFANSILSTAQSQKSTTSTCHDAVLLYKFPKRDLKTGLV